MHLKLEGLNIAGSIKFKTALAMVEDLERRGIIRPETNTIIESSSGNLGVALSIVCCAKGYEFMCVTDPTASPGIADLIRAYGGRVVVITERDGQNGYLSNRIKYIERQVRAHPSMVWTNQYANPRNTLAHYRTTAREIHDQFPDLDVLFIGAGTTGTLTGCARYFGLHRPQVRIIAVDVVGSVTFGYPSGRRYIPGLGTSQRPEIASLDYVFDIVRVPERATIQMCRRLRDRYGLLVGGSTGTVMSGIEDYAPKIPDDAVVVAISPDFGDRYARTLYDHEWLAQRDLHDGPLGRTGRWNGATINRTGSLTTTSLTN